MDEKDILDNSFNLIFAFDEIVALGYRESVNLAQIRTWQPLGLHARLGTSPAPLAKARPACSPAGLVDRFL